MSPAEFIDRHSNALLEDLSQLVSTPTVNPPGENYDAITTWLTAKLSGLGLKARRFTIPAALLRKALPPGW